MTSGEIFEQIKTELRADLGELSETEVSAISDGIHGHSWRQPLFQHNAAGVQAKERWLKAFAAGVRHAARYIAAASKE